MEIAQFILTLVSTTPMEVDETNPNIVCPSCGGGRSKEKTFSYTRKVDGVLYNCYRATCGERGFIPYGRALAPKKKKKEFVPKLYTDPLRRLGVEAYQFFNKKFGITRQELLAAGVKYNTKRDSYVFPIRDYRGYNVGVQDRAYWGRKPKSIHYWSNDCVKVHFHWSMSTKIWPWTPLGDEQPPILLVEDQLSAIKASRFIDTVALLGTNFNYETASHLLSFTDHIIMCLDGDATKKAIRYKEKFGVMFGNFNVKMLSKGGDIKDLSNKEIEELLSEYL